MTPLPSQQQEKLTRVRDLAEKFAIHNPDLTPMHCWERAARFIRFSERVADAAADIVNQTEGPKHTEEGYIAASTAELWK